MLSLVLWPRIRRTCLALGKHMAGLKMWRAFMKGWKKEFGGHARLLYAKGCDFDGNDTSSFAEASSVASQADVVILCLGEKAAWSGENASRSTIALPYIQEQLAAALYKTGTP